jgi:hypothetical protein
MGKQVGRRLSLSLPRRIICDLMHFAMKVPTVPVERRMRLGVLAAARKSALEPRPSWAALFTKAYALVARRRPELRRFYLSFPWPHLYEHPASVATLALERPWRDGEEAVFFIHIAEPDDKPAADVDARVRHAKEAPLESIGSFRRALLVGSLPRPLRRLIWWIGLNLWPRKRANLMGTFGVSAYGGLGAASLHPLSPATTALNWGVIEPDGTVDVRIIYDHRVLDGATVARVLGELESTLNGAMVEELRAAREAA